MNKRKEYIDPQKLIKPSKKRQPHIDPETLKAWQKTSLEARLEWLDAALRLGKNKSL